jgi:hypothetical protein
MNIPQQSPPVARQASEPKVREKEDSPRGQGVTAQQCYCLGGTWHCHFGRDFVNTGYPCP